MNVYCLRRNYTSTYSQESKKIRGKLSFKTKETDWANSDSPVIALVSVDSAFHEGFNGDLKMDAFIGTIKNNISGKISVLIADTAHYHVQSKQSFDQCIELGAELVKRYRSFFEGCNILYWHSSIAQDNLFVPSLAKVQHLAQIDPIFQEHLFADAESTYTKKRGEEFPDKKLFLERAVGDILEQCASLFVLSSQGYRYQFYPGAPYRAVDYVNHLFFPIEKKIHWINTFLSIEKKTYFNQN
jgi:hypothetical protein